MKKLLETLYILTPESYVFHRNENICVSVGEVEIVSIPASQVDSIVFVGKNAISTPLLEFCGEHGITITFLNQYGRFYGSHSIFSLSVAPLAGA